VTNFRAVYYFAGNGLFVAGDTLGATYELTRNGTRVGIALPTDTEVYTGFPPAEPSPRSGRVVAWEEDPPRTLAVTVDRFEVTVDVSAEAPSGDLIAEAFPLAAEVAEEFLTWVRVGASQTWLPNEHEGVTLGGPTRLLHADTGKEVQPRVAWQPPHAVFGTPASESVDLETLNDLVGSIAAGVRPSVAATLLSDAHGVMAPPPVVSAATADRADTAHAVLLAAVACEVHIKATLRNKATAQHLPLLDVILDSPREVSVAAGQLTDKPMKAATGHSLKEDDKPLFKKVVDKFFPIRNKVAHYGHKPSREETQLVLTTADELFLWLNGLPAATEDADADVDAD
jgi:hypothetical protein